MRSRHFGRRLGLAIGFALVAIAAAPAGQTTLTSGIDRADFDLSIKPGDDFFLYVNGNWIKHNPIPAAYGRWGSFSKLHDDNLIELRKLVEGLEHESGPLAGNRRKIRDLYATAMDAARRDKLGVTPLEEELDRIAKIDNRDELTAEIGHLRTFGVGALFGVSIGQDEKASTHYTVYLHQGGLGLPERDYYLGKSAYFKQIREAYQDARCEDVGVSGRFPGGGRSLRRHGGGDRDQAGRGLAHSGPAPRPRGAIQQIHARRPGQARAALELGRVLAAVEIGKLSQVIVGQPEFFTRVRRTPGDPADRAVAGLSPLAFDSCDRRGFERRGRERKLPLLRPKAARREDHAAALEAGDRRLDSQLGEALGRLYVERYFPPDAKRRMDALVKNILAAYRDRIEAVDWMGPDTKRQALAKLATVMPKIGYPDKWRDYSKLKSARIPISGICSGPTSSTGATTWPSSASRSIGRNGA